MTKIDRSAPQKSVSREKPQKAQKHTGLKLDPKETLMRDVGRRPTASTVRHAFGKDEMSAGVGRGLRDRSMKALGAGRRGSRSSGVATAWRRRQGGTGGTALRRREALR